MPRKSGLLCAINVVRGTFVPGTKKRPRRQMICERAFPFLAANLCLIKRLVALQIAFLDLLMVERF